MSDGSSCHTSGITDVMITTEADGTPIATPRHSLNAMSGRTSCGRSGVMLPGKWEDVALEDRCDDCTVGQQHR